MKEKAPERLIVCMNGYKPAIADWAKDAMRECDVEYVRADLLITSCEEARRAAFKEVIAMTKSYLWGTLTDGSIPEPAAKIAARRLRALITALEAAEKGERDG